MKELNLIGQDTTAWGTDRPGGLELADLQQRDAPARPPQAAAELLRIAAEGLGQVLGTRGGKAGQERKG